MDMFYFLWIIGCQIRYEYGDYSEMGISEFNRFLSQAFFVSITDKSPSNCCRKSVTSDYNPH